MPAKKPNRKPNGNPSKPRKITGNAAEEFGGDYFNGDDLLAMRRKLRGKDFEITDLKKIEFEDGHKWVLMTDEFDQGFKINKPSGKRLRVSFGDDMGQWVGRRVEIGVVEYSVGVGADIHPAEDGDTDNDGDDESVD